MFRIKICGITSVEDAAAAARAGADALGLNFYARSPRFLRPELARAVAEAVPPGVLKVGLFVNAPAEEVCRAFDELRFDLIQLHGDEPPAFLASLAPRPVMRAFRLGANRGAGCQPAGQKAGWQPAPRTEASSYGGGLQAIADYLGECRRLQCVPRMVLIDAGVPGQYGGTGVTADWAALAGHGLGAWDPPLVLAGGLTPRNVAEAIRTVRPSAVDTASGVESSPGRKNPEAMVAFVRAAREAFLGGQASGERVQGSGFRIQDSDGS
jgi:phosphoribosylanthranilate isomerase